MREIKFRGKNIVSNKWEYGFLLIDGDLVMIAQDSAHRVSVDPQTVGQYINLKDKKGNEIYTGDILGRCSRNRYGNYTKVYGVVEFGHYLEHQQDDWNNWDEHHYGFYMNGYSFYENLSFLEVIGDKYDNINLLQKIK